MQQPDIRDSSVCIWEKQCRLSLTSLSIYSTRILRIFNNQERLQKTSSYFFESIIALAFLSTLPDVQSISTQCFSLKTEEPAPIIKPSRISQVNSLLPKILTISNSFEICGPFASNSWVLRLQRTSPELSYLCFLVYHTTQLQTLFLLVISNINMIDR